MEKSRGFYKIEKRNHAKNGCPKGIGQPSMESFVWQLFCEIEEDGGRNEYDLDGERNGNGKIVFSAVA